MSTTLEQGGRVNQRLLAELAKVSRSTVTRALANDPRISPEVTRRIRRLAQEHGYRPNAAARSIATQRNNCIGAVLCNRALTQRGYGRLITGIEDAARRAGLRLQLAVCDTTQLGDDELPPIFEEVGVDGVILMGDVSEWLLSKLRHWVVPNVLVGSNPDAVGVSQVAGDPQLAGLILTRHLLGLGHRRIGLLVGPRRNALHLAYAQGYQRAMTEAGHTPADIETMIEECPSPDVIDPMGRLLAREPKLTALFSDTDDVAWHAMQYLRARGVDVPGQFSIAGAGGGDGMGAWPITLTSVDVGLDEMARTAVNLLIDLTRTPHCGAKRIVIQPQIVIGQSAAAITVATSS
jgi:DNA-binding LacI/PurR family transcriptional regulator